MTLSMFPAVHSVELPAVHAHVFAVRQAPPAWTPGGSGFLVKPGMTRGFGAGWWFIGYSARTGFRVKPGMTWWGRAYMWAFFYPRIKTFAHKSRKLNPDHEANAPDAQLQ